MEGRLRCREPFYDKPGKYLPQNVYIPNQDELTDPILPNEILCNVLKDGDHVYIDLQSSVVNSIFSIEVE